MRNFLRGVIVLGAMLAGDAMAGVDVHLAATAGLSSGGETLAEVIYTDGSSAKIKSGGLIYFGAGPSMEFKNTPWSVQALLGRHFDSVSADNGELSFGRNTLDAQVFYRVGNHRLGFGMVKHSDVEYEQSGFAEPPVTGRFSDARGMALEYNLLPVGSNFGLSLRAVRIDYTLESVDGLPAPAKEFSGNHFAAGLYLYL